MRIALLTAHKKLLEELENSKVSSTSELTPEFLSKLSPEALRALQTMEIR